MNCLKVVQVWEHACVDQCTGATLVYYALHVPGSWQLLLMASLIDVICLTFFGEHKNVAEKNKSSCMVVCLTLSQGQEEINNYASHLPVCLSDCLWVRVSISSISSPSSALQKRRKLTIMLLILTLWLSAKNKWLNLFCLVFVWLVWASTCRFSYLPTGEGSQPWPLKMYCSVIRFVFMCIYESVYFDVHTHLIIYVEMTAWM